MACTTLSGPENGEVNPMDGVEGDTAVYSCNQGYMLVGDEIRTCGANGWSEVQPVCTEIPVGTSYNNMPQFPVCTYR